jgi:hypothetical protein
VDEAVVRAIAKWPNVPAAYGWLSLDRRGDWFVKGARIANPAVVDFIGRNYAADAAGRWFFQNGPQRVFVKLEYTPFVVRTQTAEGPLALRTHTGQRVEAIDGAWVDEHGALLLGTLGSAGLVHDRDLEALLPHLLDAQGAVLEDERVEAWLAGAALEVRLRAGDHAVPVQRIASASLPSRFGFDPEPRPLPGEPEC